jgi:hypothetical protein
MGLCKFLLNTALLITQCWMNQLLLQSSNYSITSQKAWICIAVNFFFMIHFYLKLPSQFTVLFFFGVFQHGRSHAHVAVHVVSKLAANYTLPSNGWFYDTLYTTEMAALAVLTVHILHCVLSNSLYAFRKVQKELLVTLRTCVEWHV